MTGKSVPKEDASPRIRRTALGCPAPQDECDMCEEVIRENCTKFVSKSAVLALVDAKIDEDDKDTMEHDAPRWAGASLKKLRAEIEGM